eukprot:TRINITY_DN3178_c0_g5_i1.p1 TRINITY_DN3178_c0_g5~~TRINITY_DN3178_c0_g5_i1.p1  ORF type:complete len:420 (-),score=57.98 TRINITY_DN3178_c0_g5_i1:129-1388(-)
MKVIHDLLLKSPPPITAFHDGVHPETEVTLCCVALLLSGILCSAAGIGGGGVFVAVLMVVGHVEPYYAVPLSKAIVFFGAVATLIVNLSRMYLHGRCNNKDVMDFHAVKNIVPWALVGTYLGVMINPYIHDVWILSILVFVLISMTFMVVKTAYTQSCEEATATNEQHEESASEEPKLLIPSVQVALDLLKRRLPKSTLGEMSFVDMAWLACTLFLIIGAGGMRVRIQYKCHTTQAECPNTLLSEFLVLSVPFVSCLSMASYYGFRTAHETSWGTRLVLACQVVGFFTGILAGLVGVGGGLIISPFLLLSGFEPSVAVGTSSTIVLFTSTSTTMQYALTNRIPLRLASIYGAVTLIASYIGTSCVHKLSDTFSSRKSYITIIVAVGVALSAVLVAMKLNTLLHRHDGIENNLHTWSSIE